MKVKAREAARRRAVARWQWAMGALTELGAAIGRAIDRGLTEGLFIELLDWLADPPSSS